MHEFIGNFRKNGFDTRIKILGTMYQVPTINGEGTIYRGEVSADIGKTVHQVGTMVLKEFAKDYLSEEKYTEARPQAIEEKYRWLKRRNFPVVPTLRVDPENQLILMTDITRNGRDQLVDKHMNNLHKVPVDNIDAIKAQLLYVAESAFANGNGVFLGSDAYAISVDPTGIGKLYILDLGFLSHRIQDGKPAYLFADWTNGKTYTLDQAREQAIGFLFDIRYPPLRTSR